MFIALTFLLAVGCAAPGIAKLSAQPRMVASATHFGVPWPQYRLIGVAELAAAAGVLAGMFWRPLGVAAALGNVVLLVGALAFHRRTGDNVQEAMPALVALALSAAYLVVALPR